VREQRDESLDLLLDLARPVAGDLVLDYAAGAGLAGFAVAAEVAAVRAVDDASELLEEGRRLAAELGLTNVAFEQVDLQSLPYDDGAFSLVICRDALHLQSDPAATLTELRRVLADGGRIVLLDPMVDERSDATLNDLAGLRRPDHRRFYRRDELESLVEQAGLAVQQRGCVRQTVDLGYWLSVAGLARPQAAAIEARFRALPVEAQLALDVAFSDRLVSFSYDIVGLQLERA
jgi:SAM-dependent methyltransferase